MRDVLALVERPPLLERLEGPSSRRKGRTRGRDGGGERSEKSSDGMGFGIIALIYSLLVDFSLPGSISIEAGTDNFARHSRSRGRCVNGTGRRLCPYGRVECAESPRFSFDLCFE